MNIVRSTAALLGVFTLSATMAHGQARFIFQDVKNFRIVGPDQSNYEGGSLNGTLVDGRIPLLPCPAMTASGMFVPSGAFLTFVPPSPGCAAGTTGLLSTTAFDVNEDGVRDSGLFVSVAQPTPALNVEPFQTSLVSLSSAPPSALPRPLGGFAWQDASTIVFYDIINDPRNGQAFEATVYQSTRPYTDLDLERHRDEVVPGSYIFTFPALGSNRANPRSFLINAAHRTMAEAFPGPGGRSVTSSGISVGNDFRLANDERWSNGAMEFDPRIVSEFRWEGFNGITFLTGDRLFFAIRNRVTDDITFPPFPGGGAGNSQLISGNGVGVANGYELGPTFFSLGDEMVGELEFRRNLMVGNTTDTSVRWFRWNINFIDTFEGHLADAFPVGTLDFELEPDYDFDDDGFTNLEEYGLLTDPIDPASVPNPTPTLDEFTMHCELVIPKRPFVGSRLNYFIEYSFNLETWTVIDENDPNWFLVVDDDDEIAVLSRRPAAVAPCFTRVRLSLN